MNGFKTLITGVAATLLSVLSAFAANGEQGNPPEMTVREKRPDGIPVPETFGSSRLRDWNVLDGRNLVIELHDGRKYKASLMSYCHGLPFTDVLGFSTRGPFELDEWTTLYLPDGERCYVKELTPYTEEAKS